MLMFLDLSASKRFTISTMVALPAKQLRIKAAYRSSKPSLKMACCVHFVPVVSGEVQAWLVCCAKALWGVSSTPPPQQSYKQG